MPKIKKETQPGQKSFTLRAKSVMVGVYCAGSFAPLTKPNKISYPNLLVGLLLPPFRPSVGGFLRINSVSSAQHAFEKAVSSACNDTALSKK